MVIITNLTGESLPLRDVDALARTRGTNGEYQIKMIAHKTERNKEAFDLITEESIITLPDRNKFRVKAREKNTVDKTVRLEVTALHTLYDNVSNYQYNVIEGEKVLSLHQALKHAFEGTDITFYIEDDFDNYSFENFGDDNSIALFNKIKDNFEFEFTIENNTHLRIYKQLGKVADTQLRYKHNIKTIKLEDNTHNLSTYVKGYYGDQQEDEDGEKIQDTYEFETDYTSPNADKYGILHATPYKNEKIKHEDTMQRYLKARLIDEPEMFLTIEYQQFINNLTKELEDVELGDSLYLIHEPMDIQFKIRINEVIDFPLHPQIKPIYTLSTNPISLIDNNTLPHISKNNNDKEINNIKGNQSDFNSRIEDAKEAIMEAENALKELDQELDYLNNEVLPEVEQVVDSVRIPAQPTPPDSIPTSGLWKDSSQNPPRIMRWDGDKWVVLAPTGDEIDDLMDELRQEAIDNMNDLLIDWSQYQEYIERRTQEIIDELESKVDLEKYEQEYDIIVESLQDKVDSFDFDNLTGRFENIKKEVVDLESEVSTKLSKTEFDDAVGVNKWTIDSYEVTGTDFKQTNPSFEFIKEKSPIFSDEIDDSVLINIPKETNRIHHLFTNVKMNSNKTISLTIDYRNSIAVFMNGAMIHRNYGLNTNSANVSLSLRKGWNTVEILLGSSTTNPLLQLSNKLSSLVEKMTTVIGVGDKNESRLAHNETIIKQTQEEILLKADQTVVTQLGNDIKDNSAAIKVNADNISQSVKQTEFNKYTKRLTDAEASIQINADNIEQTVKKTEYDKLNKKVNDNSSSIVQTENSITSAVKSIEAVGKKTDSLRDEFDNLEIGGRNLVLGTSSDFRTVSHGRHYATIPITNGTKFVIGDYGLKPGDIITYRVYVKTGSVAGAQARLRAHRADGTNHGNIMGTSIGKNSEGYVYATGAIPSNTHDFIIAINARDNGTSTGTFQYKEVQIEKGNKATDWTPAPEDAAERISLAETAIEQNEKAINLRATKTELNKVTGDLSKAVSRIEINENGIKNTVSKEEFGGLSNKVNSVQTTVNQLPDQISLMVSEGIEDTGTIAYFDGGTNSFLNIPSMGSYNSFTILTKVYVEDLEQVRGIFGQGASSPGHFEVQASGRLRIRVGNFDEGTSSGFIKEKEWYQISVVLNSSNNRLKVIVNDKVEIDKVVTRNPLNMSSGARIGNSYSSNGREFKGYIDGFSLWSRALSDSEVERYSKTEPNSTASGLLAYYSLRNKSLRDAGAGNRHASNAGGIKWSSISGLTMENQVNKTNVLSSINLSKEGVKIQGNKIDIDGVVEFMNAKKNLLPVGINSWLELSSTMYGMIGIPVKPNTNYTIYDIAPSSSRFFSYLLSYVSKSNIQIDSSSSTSRQHTFKTPSNCYFVNLIIQTSSKPSDLRITMVEGTGALTSDINSTMIHGGMIATGSITAEELNVDTIFADSAVIAEIQAGAIKTAKLDAEQITAGVIDASKISVVNLSATNIKSGVLNAINITGGTITGSKIVGGQITSTSTIDVATDVNIGNNIYIGAPNGTQDKRIIMGTYNSPNDFSGLRYTGQDNKLTMFAKDIELIGRTEISAAKLGIVSGKVNFKDGIDTPRIDVTNLSSRSNPLQPSRIIKLESKTIGGNGGVGLFRGDSFAGIFMTTARVKLTVPISSGSNTLNVFEVTRDSVEAVAAYNSTSSNSANMRVGASGRFYRTTSASKYKLLIEDEIEKGHNYNGILDLKIKSWYDKRNTETFADCLSGEKSLNKEDVHNVKRHYGLIAEDVKDAGLSQFVDYNEKTNEIEGIQYDRLWINLIPLVREQKEKIESQENRIQQLEQQMEQLLA